MSDLTILSTGIPLCEKCQAAWLAEPGGYWPRVKFLRIHRGHR